MKRGKRVLYGLCAFAFLLVAVFLQRRSESYLAEMAHFDVLHFSGAFTGESYGQMYDDLQESVAPPAFALWEQVEQVAVGESVMARNAQAALLRIAGDTRLVHPSSHTLAPYDPQGCLIDETLALALFRTLDVVGLEITVEEKNYTIRGVMNDAGGLVLLRPGADDALPYATVENNRGAQSFSMLFGAQKRGLQPRFYENMARLFCALPICTAIALCYGFIRGARKRVRLYPLPYGLALCGEIALLTAGVLYLLTLIPIEYIPARWSDFGAYETIFQEIGDGFTAFFQAEKTLPDMRLASALLGAAQGLVSALFLLMACFFFQKGRKKARLLQKAKGLPQKNRFVHPPRPDTAPL